MARDALLVVDVQNDFCPGGALPVPDGDRVVPVLNAYIERFTAAGYPVFASRDWHPPQTKHFREWGGPWPPHCVQETEGAAFHRALRLPADAVVVTKGTDPEDDGYSAFEGKDEAGTRLGEVLRERGVTRLFVGGLATDYCVGASARDALRAGFEVVLLLDAMRGIDVEPGDVARALDGLLRAGARTATLETVSGGGPAGGRDQGA
jgi:nicotinamidase/pyrazinamidase